ncbi:MAG: response regulator [Actinobacteria bacterium]|nr:response regulator [Actinomycetota bacterium]
MRTHRILILVTEKDGVIKEVASYFSDLKGCEVVFIQSGLEAIDIVKKSPPDIIIMDLLLQKLDGIRVCRILKKNKTTSNIPIIILTLVQAKKRSLEAGADVFILKPVRSADLIDIISNILLKQGVNKVGETAI